MPRNKRITIFKRHLKHLEYSLSCELSKDLSTIISAISKHSIFQTTKTSTQLTLFQVPVNQQN